MKAILLSLIMILYHSSAFARRDKLFFYSVWGAGVGTGREVALWVGADVIYKRHSFSFRYSGSLWPAPGTPDDYFPGTHIKHSGTLRAFNNLSTVMYGRVWYIHKYARFILKAGVSGGRYTYPTSFVYTPFVQPVDSQRANYTFEFRTVPVYGVKLTPALEIVSPVVGGSLGLYAYANTVNTGAGIEFSFLLGKLRKKYNRPVVVE
jgi:hypothetical protein